MLEVVFGIFFFALGACLGSFACASVWRLRAHQLAGDKKARRKYDKTEYSRVSKLANRSALRDRSVCLSCGYQLRWFDLVPIVSWLQLRGRCRKCRQAIGWTELAAELLLGVAFLGTYVLLRPTVVDGLSLAAFMVWLVFLTTLTVLFIYDLKWSLMPSKVLYFSVACAIILLICNILQGSFVTAQIPSLLVTLAILPGLYLLLYLVSRGRWVGSGDWILALSLALVLQHYFFALIALFASNLLGCVVYFLNVVSKSQRKLTKMPFGPLLIVGALIAYLLKFHLSLAFLPL
jgi:prepilin signal peptidase PulO-like enzyme (type II secretory pathway)